LFSRFYDFINNNLVEESKILPDKEHYILLLDEADLAFHPSWKRKFIKSIISTIPFFFHHLNRTPSLQIVFTTHDPLTLSDIPQNNVVYLDKDENNITVVNHDKLQSFGANVHDLLAHSFFLEDGFMGEFAQYMITDLINYLTFNEEKEISEENLKHVQAWNNDKAKKVIAIIDEPLIKERVQSLYNEKFLNKDKELLRQQIQELNIQLKKLDDAEN
jgi:predicted ATP-binding protein involved in virulence